MTPSKKVLDIESSCAEKSSPFEILTTRSYENDYSASLWEFKMTRWNDSCHENGHLLTRNGLNNIVQGITLPWTVKTQSALRWPFVRERPWQINKVFNENAHRITHNRE